MRRGCWRLRVCGAVLVSERRMMISGHAWLLGTHETVSGSERDLMRTLCLPPPGVRRAVSGSEPRMMRPGRSWLLGVRGAVSESERHMMRSVCSRPLGVREAVSGSERATIQSGTLTVVLLFALSLLLLLLSFLALLCEAVSGS